MPTAINVLDKQHVMNGGLITDFGEQGKILGDTECCLAC